MKEQLFERRHRQIIQDQLNYCFAFSTVATLRQELSVVPLVDELHSRGDKGCECFLQDTVDGGTHGELGCLRY